MILSSLLSSSNYIIVNKDLIKIFGLNEAVILGELCSEYTYWESVNKLVNNCYFYSTRENIENNTGLNAHFQRIALKNLEQKGIISVKRMGIPCKIYYKIHENAIVECLKRANIPVANEVNDKETTSATTNNLSDKSPDDNIMDGNNNNINNKKINNKEYTHEIEKEGYNYKTLKNKQNTNKTKANFDQIKIC